LTERHGLLVAHPFRLRPLDLLWSNRGIIEHFRWHAGEATRLVRMDLGDGSIHVHETDPLFCFHTVHAFETDRATVLDLLAYDDASIVSALSIASLADGFPDRGPKLVRLSIDRASGRVERRTLSDTTFEFPQVDRNFVGSHAERFVFGAALQNRAGALSSEIVRVDVSNGTTRRYGDRELIFGEPLFVGAPNREREGDGVLLSVGSAERGSTLVVLDATTLEPISQIQFETKLPLGFHGSFVRS
jgi:carotenoid cleavage dioxygenase-like enzyme